VPYHIVREVSILKGVDHPNVVRLVEVAHREDDVSLVYEYLPQDLRKVLDVKRDWMGAPEGADCMEGDGGWRDDPALCSKQMKEYFRQVLEGVSFLHSRCILHRDLKPTDLRIDDTNTVKISNFRLARTFTLPLRTYTHEVVTLWYRAPEILLGKKRYDTSIDMWSAGCILAEITTGDAIFMGDSEIDQLYQIFRLLGTPTPTEWPGVRSLPDYKATFPKWPAKMFEDAVKGVTPDGEDLLSQMLVYDSANRLTARRALAHPFFHELVGWEAPTTRPEPVLPPNANK
jgi:serine/threonine protein kinase